VPLVLLERSWWAGFNGIYLVRFGFRMWEMFIFKRLQPKTRFWKDKSVEDMVTLGPTAQATLVICKLAQSPMQKFHKFRYTHLLCPKSKDFCNKLECTWFFDQIASSVCLKLSRFDWRTFDALPTWLIYFGHNYKFVFAA